MEQEDRSMASSVSFKVWVKICFSEIIPGIKENLTLYFQEKKSIVWSCIICL